MPSRELRSHRRVDANIVFEIRRSPTASQGREKGCLVDIGEGGAGLETEARLERGQLIFFEVPVPLRVTARVVYAVGQGQRFRYGLKFKRANLLDWWQLRKYIRTRVVPK